MAGKPLPQNPSISRLTSLPEKIPSCYPKTAPSEFQPLSRRHPRIAVVTDCHQTSRVAHAIRAGASGYLSYGLTFDSLVRSLELVAMGDSIVSNSFLSSVVGKERAGDCVPGAYGRDTKFATDEVESMSSLERLILHYLVVGESNKIIARRVSLTEAAVKVHVKTIFRKIRVSNRTQAAIWGLKSGLQSVPNGPSKSGGTERRKQSASDVLLDRVSPAQSR